MIILKDFTQFPKPDCILHRSVRDDLHHCCNWQLPGHVRHHLQETQDRDQHVHRKPRPGRHHHRDVCNSISVSSNFTSTMDASTIYVQGFNKTFQ